MSTEISAAKRVVDTGNTQVNYIEAGRGTPLVAIADAAQPHLYKSDMILAEQRRVICFGTSAPASDGGPAAKHVIDALGKLGLDRFDLIGYGDGALVALNVANLTPGVSSITLVSPHGDVNQTFVGVKCPALTLFGTNDENASVERGRVIELRPVHSHLMYVYDAGSSIGDERPEALAFIVREFLERSDEFLVSRENGKLLP